MHWSFREPNHYMGKCSAKRPSHIKDNTNNFENCKRCLSP